MNDDHLPPEHAEPSAPYDLGPFNDALAMLESASRKTDFRNKILLWLGTPVIIIAMIVAAISAMRPAQANVKTVTIYCYLYDRSTRAHKISTNHPPVCDATTTNISELVPLQKDPAAQDAITRALLPLFVRKAFSITTPVATATDISEFVTPYLAPHSTAYQWFTDYYSHNNVAKLALTQTTDVTVDEIPPPTTPGTYFVGYTLTASNGTTSTANHYVATVKVQYAAPHGPDTSGLEVYTFTPEAQSPATVPGDN